MVSSPFAPLVCKTSQRRTVGNLTAGSRFDFDRDRDATLAVTSTSSCQPRAFHPSVTSCLRFSWQCLLERGRQTGASELMTGEALSRMSSQAGRASQGNSMLSSDRISPLFLWLPPSSGAGDVGGNLSGIQLAAVSLLMEKMIAVPSSKARQSRRFERETPRHSSRRNDWNE